jgi:hypothetical protein
MKLNITVVLFILSILMSCQNKKENSLVEKGKVNFKKSNYFDEDRIKSNKYDVKYKGDRSAYSELILYYSYNKLRKEELLPYSLIMVEKHKQYDFCTNVFYNLIEFYSEKENQFDGTSASLIREYKKIELLNEDQRKFCLYFIKLGTRNNDIESLNCLEVLNRKGIGMKKNLVKADSLKNILIANKIK